MYVPNVVEKLKKPREHPTPEKVKAIKDALKYFGIIKWEEGLFETST